MALPGKLPCSWRMTLLVELLGPLGGETAQWSSSDSGTVSLDGGCTRLWAEGSRVGAGFWQPGVPQRHRAAATWDAPSIWQAEAGGAAGCPTVPGTPHLRAEPSRLVASAAMRSCRRIGLSLSQGGSTCNTTAHTPVPVTVSGCPAVPSHSQSSLIVQKVTARDAQWRGPAAPRARPHTATLVLGRSVVSEDVGSSWGCPAFPERV